jgi:hypothetical protein
MGFRSSNLFAVAIIPTLLTLIFYVGTLATMLLDGTVARGWGIHLILLKKTSD